MSYQSFEQVLQKCHTEEKEFWQVILEDDMAERNVSLQESMEHMRATWDAMLLAAATYEGNLNSSSGLVGGDGRRMEEYIHSAVTESLCGEYVDTCIAGALQMGESNACMKRIVAAPTAGACGVLPAVLVPYFQKRCRNTDKILKAMEYIQLHELLTHVCGVVLKSGVDVKNLITIIGTCPAPPL